MYSKPQQMEPLLPQLMAELEDQAREVLSRSAALCGKLPPVTQRALTELLRIINSYYSNLIEGHSTHPVEIERAMREDYSRDPAKRHLQIESLAHINCQRQIERRTQEAPPLSVADPDFLQWVHRIFYEQLPDVLRQVKNEQTGEALEVVGGELRQREIQVGRHIGPTWTSISDFLDRFAQFYRSGAHHGLTPIIAAAASHHRLMWIHPFLDGNGRVARLYTDAAFRKVPLLGYGLWNVSRGLARSRDEYMAALSWADAPRRNDYDGRGNLSNEGLTQFCRFFLDICLDQISYMDKLLVLDGLLERLRGYVQLRSAKVLPGPTPTSGPLKPEATFMLQEVLLRGEVARGDLTRVSGLPERTARLITAQLLEEKALVSDMPKGPVRLEFTTHLAGYLFPDLFPVQLRIQA